MKKLFALLGLLTLGGTLSAQVSMVRLTRFEGQRIVGVSTSSAFDVELIQSDHTYAVVEINAEYENMLQFELNNQGIITLGFNSTLKSRLQDVEYRAKIYLSELAYIQASGASDIQCTGNFESNTTRIELSGASDLEGLTLATTGEINIQASGASDITGCIFHCQSLTSTLSGSSEMEISTFKGNLFTHLSGAAEMKIAGFADVADIQVVGASEFDGTGLTTVNTKLIASSASSVRMGSIQGDLTANGSSASSITYQGTPTIRNITMSSASTIKKVL